MMSSWFRYYVPEFRYSGIVELNPKDPYRQAAKAITNECHGLHRLQLFLPEDLLLEPEHDLEERATRWLAQHSANPVNQLKFIATNFPQGIDISRDVFHFLAVPEQTLEDLETLASLPDPALLPLLKGRRSQLATFSGGPSPSSATKTYDSVLKAWSAPDGIHGGRPPENYGPPVALFSPILANFKHNLTRLDDIEPSAVFLCLAQEFIETATRFYPDESIRERKVKDFFTILFDALGACQVFSTSKDVRPDAFWDLVAVLGLKNEKGLGGDALLQALLSYRKLLADPKYESYVKAANCPSIVIGLAGTLFEVAGAVFTDAIYTETLFAIDLRLGFDKDAAVLRLARFLLVLRDTFHDIGRHYQALATTAPSSRTSLFFPSPVRLSGDEIPSSLTYISKLSRLGNTLDVDRCHGIYVANISHDTPPRRVVVKFATSYDAKAHRLLEKHQLAPALHCCCLLKGGYVMVVMDYMEGKTVWQIIKDEGRIPVKVYNDVARAISLLHGENLVFGDLRLPNIMVTKSGDTRLIDFDWVSVEGMCRYPATLNEDIVVDSWAPGVERRGLMTKAHDLFMLAKLHSWCILE